MNPIVMNPIVAKIIRPLVILISLLLPLQLACATEDRLPPHDDEHQTTERQSARMAANVPLRHYSDSDFLALICPLAGYNRNVMTVRGEPRGQQLTKLTDTAPIYGLFLLVGHPRFVANDFIFYSKPNDTEVLGNLLYLNVYGDPEASITWNLGGGHFYHKIKPSKEDIEVQVPMLKVGTLIRIKPWGITLNPYLGYAWERIETRQANISNDSLLYGLSVDWRWRMVNLNVKYYYQDSRDGYESYRAVRARCVVGLNRHWGVAMRYDYMEQMAADNSSLMIGPVYVF